MQHEELIRKIIGCAMKVHTALGNGFQEVVYQGSLAVEMELQHISFQREAEIPVFYQQVLVGTRRVDFLVENKVLVELKALSALEDVHLTQAKKYLEAFQVEVRLRINFGAKSLAFKRLINAKKKREE